MKSSKNVITGSLWGELPARETLKQEIITPDIIENVWRQVLQESSDDCDYPLDNESEYIQLPMGNHHVLNTIKFHQQLRVMDAGDAGAVEVRDLQEIVQPQCPFQFLCSEEKRTAFRSSATHHLTPEAAGHLLKHAIVVLIAHIGFEKATDVAIETLTDIVDHFLRRITLLMKAAHEQEDHGFPDFIERVLLETGIGSVASLHNYYQEYILKFEQNMKKKVETMLERQRIILDEAASKLQFQDLDEFGNTYREVPTLQLLDPEMGFPPSLDAGFQMLYSLEQDELNSLEIEEDEVNVSDSPSTGLRVETIGHKKHFS